MKKKEDPEQQSIELELLGSSNCEEDEKEAETNKLYGNDINIKRPKKLGRLRALLYIKDYPLIMIGSKCKLFFNIIFFIYISFKFYFSSCNNDINIYVFYIYHKRY